MPTDIKKMQRFLGVGIFFSEFIPDYATKSAKLYDMTKPTGIRLHGKKIT
jgi:hypothetical protein